MDLFNDLPEPKNTISAEVDKELNLNNKRLLSESDDRELNKKHVARSEFCFRGYSADKQGERDTMQDRHVIIDDFIQQITDCPAELKNLSYYAVFDGHAGDRASVYCAENIHKILADKFSKAFGNRASLEHIEKDMKRYFIEAFKQCDEEFLKIASKNKPAWKDGSTASVILILNKTVYSANIGDSKAIICRTKENSQTSSLNQIIELTKEHSASIYEERQRIQKCGGQVRDGRVLGVLEISRSIGDGPFKAYGVTCLPDMRKCQLNPFYKYIILACDGLWKSFSNEESVQLVDEIVKKQFEENEIKAGSSSQCIYETCCEKLATEAIKKLSADNVTVLIISIESKSD